MSANPTANREPFESAPGDRSQAEATLREQREFLRATLASVGDAVLTTDAGGRVTFLNPVAESLTGWTCQEARGLPLETVFRIVKEEGRGPAENTVARALRPSAIIWTLATGCSVSRHLLIACSPFCPST